MQRRLEKMAEEEQPKDLNYIPEVILKKRKHSEAWALSKKAQLQKKGFQLRKSKDFIKKPEDFIFEYRNRVSFLNIPPFILLFSIYEFFNILLACVLMFVISLN